MRVKTPIDYRTFIHLMNHCKKSDAVNASGITLPEDAIFLERLPKKLNESMFTGPRSPMQFGWGVHIIEGPDKVILSIATFVGLLLSFVVSILYAHFYKTEESGVGIGQWIVAAIAAGMAALYFQCTEP